MLSNLQPLCVACNRRKSASGLAEDWVAVQLAGRTKPPKDRS